MRWPPTAGAGLTHSKYRLELVEFMLLGVTLHWLDSRNTTFILQMDKLGRLSGYITECLGAYALGVRASVMHHGLFSPLSWLPVFLSLLFLSLPLKINYIHVFVFLNLAFVELKPGHFLVSPALCCHLKHSRTTTMAFEASHHLNVLAPGCQLPRLAEYLRSSAWTNSIHFQWPSFAWSWSLYPL